MNNKYLSSRITYALSCAATLYLSSNAHGEKLFEFDVPRQPLDRALPVLIDAPRTQVEASSASIAPDGDIGVVSGPLTHSSAPARLGDREPTGLLSARASSSSKLPAESEEMPYAAAASLAQNKDQRSRPGKSNDQAGRESSESARIETVLVTAQKREERLQDVPLSIAAITFEDIERRGIIGMEDLLRSMPSVNQIDNGAVSNAVVIRGITTSPQFENFASGTTVATYFGETPITAAAGLGAGGIDVRPVDIERIEVMRGPQGTTYGSSSLGGAVRILPMKPNVDEFQTRIVGSYSNTGGAGGDNSMLQAVMNVPVVENSLGFRAVGYRYVDSGFYRNIAGADPATLAVAERNGLASYLQEHVQDDIGRMLSTGGRLAALWKTTDKLTFSMNLLTQRIEQDGAPIATTTGYQQSRFPVSPQNRRRGEVGEIADTDIDLLSATLNYEFGWATLTSVASWIESGSVIAETSNFSNGISSALDSEFRSFTGETRVASNLPGRLQFLAGFFYEDVDNDFQQVATWPGPQSTNPYSTNPDYIIAENRKLEQQALFGEVSYQLSQKLSITGGARMFEYDKDEQILTEGGLYGVALGAGVQRELDTSESDQSKKASLSYKPTDDSLLYASWSNGFRLGRPNAGLPTTCDSNNDGLLDGTSVTIASTRTIQPDFLDNYELGGKFTLFDRRMVLDTAVYRIKWDGLPIRTFASACGLSYVANVGAATSTGVEAQISVYATDHLRIDVGGSYTQAELDEDAPALSATEGARLPGSPKVSANLSAQYEFQFGTYKAFVRADSFYTGEFYGDLIESPNTRAGDYVKIDTRAGLTFGSLQVEIFVRNLTNEDAFTWRWTRPITPSYGYRLRPRTIGIQLGYSFD